MCMAVTSPSRTFRSTMMHSRVGLSGSLGFTTNRPSRAIVATLRYHTCQPEMTKMTEIFGLKY